MTCLPSRTNWLSSSAPVSRLTGLEVVLLFSWPRGLFIMLRAAQTLFTTPTPSLASLSSLAPPWQGRPHPQCITWLLWLYPTMLHGSDSNNLMHSLEYVTMKVLKNPFYYHQNLNQETEINRSKPFRRRLGLLVWPIGNNLLQDCLDRHHTSLFDIRSSSVNGASSIGTISVQ